MQSAVSVIRVVLGFTSLVLLLLIIALWLGMLPDRADTVLEKRKFTTESLAITYSGVLQVEKPEQVQPVLMEVFFRIPGLLSAGIRNQEGKLILEYGEHEAEWTNREGILSTDTQMKVPIALAEAATGTLELRFSPILPPGPLGMLHDNLYQFFLFMTLSSSLAFAVYVWRIMSSVLAATSMGAVPNRVRSSLNTLAEGVLILNKQQNIVLANEAFARILGRSTKEVEGQAISEIPWIKPESQDPLSPYPWERSLTSGEANTSTILQLQGTNPRPELLSVNSTPILGTDSSYRGTMVTFDNLTQLEEKNESLQKLSDQLTLSRGEILEQNKQLEFLATRDPLTECFNRRAFLEQMSTHWATSVRYGHPLCCIMMDIDHFKAVNDTYGHAIGDEVIKHVATMMKMGKRDSDVVARFGGEEFVVLLPHVDADGAMVIAERIRKKVEQTPCGEVRYTVSIGVAELDPEAAKAGKLKPDSLLNQADEALYAAKRTGRNRVCRRDKLPDIKPDEAHQTEEPDARREESSPAPLPQRDD